MRPFSPIQHAARVNSEREQGFFLNSLRYLCLSHESIISYHNDEEFVHFLTFRFTVPGPSRNISLSILVQWNQLSGVNPQGTIMVRG